MTTSPFGTPIPAEPTPAAAPEAARSRRPLLYALGGVAAVAVLGGGAFFLLTGDEEPVVEAAPVAGGATDGGGTVAEEAPVAQAPIVALSSRNPFAAQVVAGGGGAPASAPVEGTTTTVATGSTSGGASSGGSSGGSSSGGSSSASGGSSASQQEVKQLQAAIAGIQSQIKQLQLASGGSDNSGQVDALQARLDALSAELGRLGDLMPLPLGLVSVAGDPTTNSAVFAMNGSSPVSFEPVSEGQEIVLGSQKTGIFYLDGVDTDGDNLVDMAKVTDGFNVYRVYLGEAIPMHYKLS